MKTTITTIDGRQITDLTKTYFFAGYSGNLVMSGMYTGNGPTFSGPTFTKTEWAKLLKAQTAKKRFAEATQRYYHWFKAAHYAVVNETASTARINQMIGWMNSANAKMQAAEQAVYDFGIEEF